MSSSSSSQRKHRLARALPRRLSWSKVSTLPQDASQAKKRDTERGWLLGRLSISLRVAGLRLFAALCLVSLYITFLCSACLRECASGWKGSKGSFSGGERSRKENFFSELGYSLLIKEQRWYRFKEFFKVE